MREEIKRNASEILAMMKDPRLGFATVTDAEVSKDLRYVRVYVSVLGDEESANSTLAALESGTGFFRSELGQRIRLRHTPDVSFRIDRTAQKGARIDELLAKLREDKEIEADA
jgi:ribosome-binding factor A